MSRIKIKNFGPIKEGYLDGDGFMDIEKVTVFIGNQGSGKSTVAKLISTFTWIEKALTRGDYEKNWFTRQNKLKNQFLTYFRLENYLPHQSRSLQTTIEYQGDSFNIIYKNDTLEIEKVEGKKYPLPQIMYVPAERNFIAYVKSPKELKLSSAALKEFLTEYDNAKNEMKGPMKLPINNVDVEYDKLNDIVNLKGNDYKLRLTDASSGFQSLVPLYLVSWFLSNSVKRQSEITKESMSIDELERFKKALEDIWTNESFTDEQRRAALSVLTSKFNKTAFINIVEEPEQNLFPTSQRKMLNSLLEFNNMSAGNKLIMTTHSPYLINYLTLSIKAFSVEKKLKSTEDSIRLNEIVPIRSIVSPAEIIIYELDESNGAIKRLEDYKGLPSDDNYLNNSLAESNELFAQLLEIQQGL